MSDLDLNKKVDALPFEALINIKVSGFYYARVLQLATSYVETHNLNLSQLFQELQTREPKDKVEYDLLTIVSLCESIEKSAYEQKVVVEKDTESLIKAAQETAP